MRLSLSALFLALLLVAMGAAVTGTAHADLVANGNFTTCDPTSLVPTGWTETNPATWDAGKDGVRFDTTDNEPFLTGQSSELVIGNYAPLAQNGSGPGVGTTGITQTLTTASGQQYNVSFYYLVTGTDVNQVLQVLWDNTPVFSISGQEGQSPLPWIAVSVPVMGNGTDTLTIEGYNNTDYDFVSGVSVAQASSVPIPGAFLLLGPGLVGIAALRRRLRQ